MGEHTVICPHCGARLPAGSPACTTCGAQFVGFAPPAPQPARPWGLITALVLAAAVAVVLVVTLIVLGVGWAVFLRPTPKPPPPPPVVAPPTPVAPLPAPAPTAKSAPPTLSADEARDLVAALPDVVEWRDNVTAAGGSAHIDVDSEDAGAYTVHVFEIIADQGDIPGHTATMGWYVVDKNTGDVRNMVP
jgi:hypothetical protein